MTENEPNPSVTTAEIKAKSANVKESPNPAVQPAGNETGTETIETVSHTGTARKSPKSHAARARTSGRYERFGDVIRSLTWDEWQRLLDAIDDYRHKLMIRLIYHLGCRVGEFVRIQLKHLDFGRSNVFFPAENTKTNHRRSSHVPIGLMNEVKSMLKREGRLPKRSDEVLSPDEYLFRKSKRTSRGYSENRIRQIFQKYVVKAKLDRDYGRDAKGRRLHVITVHSLRHSHIMHFIHIHKLPLPIVQKQVGHRTLKATSVYLNPCDEAVANAYERAGGDARAAESSAIRRGACTRSSFDLP